VLVVGCQVESRPSVLEKGLEGRGREREERGREKKREGEGGKGKWGEEGGRGREWTKTSLPLLLSSLSSLLFTRAYLLLVIHVRPFPY
jgi:hypothetical protein